MKYIDLWVCLMIVLSGYSCRMTKERSESVKRDAVSETQQSFISWQSVDSTGRYWHFQSDSLLYYHPDYGLYGQGGWLSIREDEVWHNGYRELDSNSGYHLKEQSERKQNRKFLSKRNIKWWAIMIVACVAILYGLKRRFFV